MKWVQCHWKPLERQLWRNVAIALIMGMSPI